MAYVTVKQLTPAFRQGALLVRVSRMWDYRGGKDGDIQHVDLVLIDQEGSAIYAEIGPNDMEAKKPLLTEGEIFVFKRFRVVDSKPTYKTVDWKFMISITYHTIIEKCPGPPPDIPRYYFRLARLQDVSSLIGETKFFIDVIGQITHIGELELVTLQYQTEPTERRIVTLRDLKLNEVKIHIWGERAIEFDADEVCSMSDTTPVVALFVGLLAKPYKGGNGLSGNTACRWYLNPDIPEAHLLLNRLKKDQKFVSRISVTPAEVVIREARVEPQTRSLREGFRCTVTLVRYNANQSWWFPSCNRCSKSCVRDGAGYKCSHDQCTAYKVKYKLCYFATDGRAEIEVVFFDQMGHRLLGKDVRHLMRTSCNSGPVPSEIAAQVGQRYQLTINVTNRAFHTSNYSYEVKSIDCAYGRQPVVPHIDLLEQLVIHVVDLPSPSADANTQNIDAPGESTSATELLQDAQNVNAPSEHALSVLQQQTQLANIGTPPPPTAPAKSPVAVVDEPSKLMDGIKHTTARKRPFKDAIVDNDQNTDDLDPALEDNNHDDVDGGSDKPPQSTMKNTTVSKKARKN